MESPSKIQEKEHSDSKQRGQEMRLGEMERQRKQCVTEEEGGGGKLPEGGYPWKSQISKGQVVQGSAPVSEPLRYRPMQHGLWHLLRPSRYCTHVHGSPREDQEGRRPGCGVRDAQPRLLLGAREGKQCS